MTVIGTSQTLVGTALNSSIAAQWARMAAHQRNEFLKIDGSALRLFTQTLVGTALNSSIAAQWARMAAHQRNEFLKIDGSALRLFTGGHCPIWDLEAG